MRNKDSVVVRFTSFGSGSAQAAARNAGDLGRSRHLSQPLALGSLAEFPPLESAASGGRSIPPKAESSRPKGGITSGGISSIARKQLDTIKDDSSSEVSTTEPYLMPDSRTQNGHATPVVQHSQRTEEQALQAQLAAAQQRCAQLEAQLLAARAAQNSSQQAANNAPEDVSTQLRERLAQVQLGAVDILQAFQDRGYEVAAALDSMQGDLEEIENASWSRSSFWNNGSSSSRQSMDNRNPRMSLEGRMRQSMDGYRPHLTTGQSGDTPMHTPVTGFANDAAMPLSSPASASPSPGTQKMVVLRARREHVESCFLELVRITVTGLEQLIDTCGLEPANTSSSSADNSSTVYTSSFHVSVD